MKALDPWLMTDTSAKIAGTLQMQLVQCYVEKGRPQVLLSTYVDECPASSELLRAVLEASKNI
jgi:hypothetical protein